MPERRAIGGQVHLEKRSDGGVTLVGYGGVYYTGAPETEYRLWGNKVERIMPGAFEGIETRDVLSLWNHDASKILGRTSSGTLRVSVDDRGLKYEVDLPNTTTASDVREYVERGDVRGSSFGFEVRPNGQAWTRDGEKIVRELRAVDVFDVGPVTEAAYAATSVEVRGELRAVGDVSDVREAYEEHAIREERARLAEIRDRELFARGIPTQRLIDHVRKCAEKHGRETRGVSRPELHAQSLRCGAEHLGLWCCEPRWLSEALQCVRTGVWAAGRPKPVPAAEEPAYRRLDGGIAEIRLDGQLMKRPSSYGGTSTLEVRQAIRQAMDDPEVFALLLTVDSPGGVAAGLDELATTIRTARKKLPVVAHIEDLGASAAYYAASAARTVTANPAAEVGSIGVYAAVYDYSGRYAADKIQVHVVSTGRYKGAFVPGSNVAPEHLEELREQVHRANDLFIAAVARHRGKPPSQVRKHYATGKLWGAHEAKRIGLIDHVMRYDDTLRMVRGMARAEAFRREEFERKWSQVESYGK